MHIFLWVSVQKWGAQLEKWGGTAPWSPRSAGPGLNGVFMFKEPFLVSWKNLQTQLQTQDIEHS